MSEGMVEVSEDFLKAFKVWAEVFSVFGEADPCERVHLVEGAVSAEVELIVAAHIAGVITLEQFKGMAKLHLMRAKEHRDSALYCTRFANGAQHTFAAFGVTLNATEVAKNEEESGGEPKE